MTNGWMQDKEKAERVNQSLMTNTPSAFKFVNGGEIQKIAAKTGYNQSFKGSTLPLHDQLDVPGAKGITILRGSHINPSFSKHMKTKSNLIIASQLSQSVPVPE
jgi:hypothetical protein